VTIVSKVELPTRFGHFRAIAFAADPAGKEHVALVHGEVAGKEAVPTRLHSECLTGDVLGSLRCDCRDQLTASLEALARHDSGILLYLRQEGRGIGLANKLRAYALQEHGFDTFEANRLLGFAEDARDYGGAAEMLRALNVRSVRLMTNNPSKMDGLREHGIDVVGRIPLVAAVNEHNVRYLDAKERSGHWLKGAHDGEDGSEAGEARTDRGRDLRLHDRAERAALLVQGRPDDRSHLPRTLEARSGG
jgi:GTP cyclohydrolase II